VIIVLKLLLITQKAKLLLVLPPFNRKSCLSVTASSFWNQGCDGK
jgi:hypothetical protein